MIALIIATIRAVKVMKQLEIEGTKLQHPIGMFFTNMFAFWLPLEAKVLSIAAVVLIPLVIVGAML